MSWTHLDKHGQAQMVDVTDKPVTQRSAMASGLVRMHPETLKEIMSAGSKKGDVLAVARIAGIQAAKRTDELIPLCHQIGLESVQIRFETIEPDQIRVESVVRNTGRTGVEMEALLAVSVSALTIYDMCKAMDRGMTIEMVRLESKTGGQSGVFQRDV